MRSEFVVKTANAGAGALSVTIDGPGTRRGEARRGRARRVEARRGKVGREEAWQGEAV